MAKEKKEEENSLPMRQPSQFSREELRGFDEEYLQNFITQLNQSITPNGQSEYTIPKQMVSKLHLVTNALASREFETKTKEALLNKHAPFIVMVCDRQRIVNEPDFVSNDPDPCEKVPVYFGYFLKELASMLTARLRNDVGDLSTVRNWAYSEIDIGTEIGKMLKKFPDKRKPRKTR